MKVIIMGMVGIIDFPGVAKESVARKLVGDVLFIPAPACWTDAVLHQYFGICFPTRSMITCKGTGCFSFECNASLGGRPVGTVMVSKFSGSMKYSRV